MIDVKSILNLSDSFCSFVEKTAVKNSKKLDQKAEVRNRPSPAFPAESSKVKDKKDHYPLGNENQARNAWARAHQTGGKAPSLYKGTYSSFLSALKRKIKSKFPSIELSDKKTKKSDLETNLTKQAALKEHIDSELDHLMKEAFLTKALATRTLEKLEKIKSTYTVEFDPELEHSIVENMPRMKEVASGSVAYIDDLHKRINELLKKVQDSSTKSHRGPISAPTV